MPLWRTYYHIVWATKERQPLISETVEPDLYGYIKGKAHTLGAIVHAIGGMEEHVHLVVSIPPMHAVAAVVRQLKGASSHHIGQLLGNQQPFQWQSGYGVFTLGARQLQDAVSYVQGQREHHRNGTTIATLEQSLDRDSGPSQVTTHVTP